MKFLSLLGLLLLCAFFENLGDAGGHLAKKPVSQFLVAMSALAIYGAIAVIVVRSGWSFTHAFPNYYIFAYKLIGWTFAACINGAKITKWDIGGGILIPARPGDHSAWDPPVETVLSHLLLASAQSNPLEPATWATRVSLGREE